MTDRINKQHRYPWAVIETAVQLYNTQGMTYRDVAERLMTHGVAVSHKTVYEWVQKFTGEVDSRAAKKKAASWSVEESYVKCNGEWKYMYRALDKGQHTVSVVLRDRRNVSSAKAFFKKSLEKE